jgi:hypothetical protein
VYRRTKTRELGIARLSNSGYTSRPRGNWRSSFFQYRAGQHHPDHIGFIRGISYSRVAIVAIDRGRLVQDSS